MCVILLCALSGGTAGWPDVPATGDIQPFKSEAAVRDAQRKANLGDDLSAQALYFHYTALNNPDEGFRWLKIAARRGNCETIETVADIYEQRKNERAALYWALKAKSKSCGNYELIELSIKQHHKH
jgi:hypothetical protein